MTHGEVAHLQQKERPQKKATLLTPWSWTSGLQKCEKIKFCCLSQKKKKKVFMHSQQAKIEIKIS